MHWFSDPIFFVPRNVIFKHKQSDHKHKEMAMKMVVTNSFKDSLTRQSNEAVRINRRQNDTLLNSKGEMNHPPVARITVEKKQGRAQPKLVSGVTKKFHLGTEMYLNNLNRWQ